MDWKIEVAMVPVTDVDRAKHFYGEQLGFAVDVDHRINDETRLVQLTPPGSGCSIMIGTGITDAPPGTARLQLVVSDIEAAHAALTGRGVATGPIEHFEDGVRMEGKGGDWNSFIFFADPDGNAWSVQERPG
jgi:catechol 2,3-dioxygenase-like lactoylglutathione lyase family enzyme